MSLFGSHRDDRRRRALAEELAGDSSTVSVSAPKSSGSKGDKTERYTSAARRENHGRATDILPRGWLPLVGWYLLSVAIVAGMLFGYANLENETIAALGLQTLLDAGQGGSLAGWYSSLVFGLAATAGVLIYSIRRYKLDDYRGRYRLWLWCAAAWIVMSIDATANLHAPFSRAMARVTGWSMLREGAIWWIATWGVVMTILALRLLVETRQCRMAMLGLIAAIALSTSALTVEYGWLPIHEHANLIAAGCRLLGQVTLLFAIAVYARHVLLDAEGLLTVRPAKPKREKVKKTKETTSSSGSESTKQTRSDASHKPTEGRGGLQSYVKAAVDRNASSSSNSSSSSSFIRGDEEEEERYSGYDDDDDDDSNYGNRKLSKAERKKMRKQARRQRDDDDDDR